MLRRPFVLIAVAAAAGAAAALAQQRDWSKIELKTSPVAEHLYMLQGAGGNIGIFTGDDGALVIDDQYAPLSERIRGEIAKLGGAPLRFVLNTHWHGDHTGGNENFARAGATIVAQDNVRSRMSVAYTNPVFGWKSEPAPPAALPVLSFDDSASFHMNGQDVVCFHVPNAHTDGDVVVWFPGLNVIHMGDTFFNRMYPIIDVGSGGTVAGMIAAHERVLKLIGPDTKVINGHGPIGTQADLQAAHDMLVTVRDQVRRLVAKKMSLEQITAAKPLADLEDAWGKGFVTTDLLLKAVVMDLNRK